MLASNTDLQNRYRVLRELGHGGMGTVYEALDQRVNCIVALKETVAGNNDEARRAFQREASLLGNLRHPVLPKVMDYFTEGDGDYLVMEFIPGYDLAELLELRESPFPLAQVLRWADKLLDVLEYLHGQQPPVVHRDIKPSNLKLTKQGEIFLLDFGLAKGAAGQMPTVMTSRSVRGYTPIYSSLEQIHGLGTDPRSDLYSLSATLYHLLTGVEPTDAPTRFNIIEDEQPDPLQPIERLNPNCTAKVAAIIRQSMSINRRLRPAGATEMRKALRQAAEEDERGAAEAEYRRAEAKRKQRDEQRQQTDGEAVRLAEEARQLQEAEARQRETERQQAEEATRHAAQERQRQETEARRLQEEARQREAERLRAEEEARRAEEERKALEIEARRLQEEAQQSEAERLRAEEGARQAEETRQRQEREARRLLEEARRREAERRQREEMERRAADELQSQEMAARRVQAAAQQKEAERRQAEEEVARLAAEARQRQELEARRLQEEATEREAERRRAEEQAARLAEKARQLRETEARRLQEEAQKREAERLRAEEEERLRAEEAARLAEEARQQQQLGSITLVEGVQEAERRKAEQAARLAEEARLRQQLGALTLVEGTPLQEAEQQLQEEMERRAEAERQELEILRLMEAARQRDIERRQRAEAEQAEEERRLAAEQEEKRANEQRQEEQPEHRDNDFGDVTLVSPAPESTTPAVPEETAPPFDSGTSILNPLEKLHPDPSEMKRRTLLLIIATPLAIVLIVALAWIWHSGLSEKPTTTNKDPQPPPSMSYVSGGTFMMGRDLGDEAERPAHQVTVKPFFIDLYEVTNQDYQKFVQATNHRSPMTWTGGVYPADAALKPVTGVTWDDAGAYVKWANKRLPTEEEWEFAARGTDGRLYPWGNSWQPNGANANGASKGLAIVGYYKATSPFGAYDMIGNAWEWTASDWRAYPGGSLPTSLTGSNLKVIRGGSYESANNYATATYRTGWPASGARTYAQTGFRCAADITNK